jgi:hypothetical protein
VQNLWQIVSSVARSQPSCESGPPECQVRLVRSQNVLCFILILQEFIFRSDECTEVYARPQRLKLHILLEHKGAVLRCSVCPLESQNRSKFLKHLRNVHQTGFNQTVHVILADTNEKLVRRRKLDESLIQTEKIVVENKVEQVANEDVDDSGI